MEMEMEKKAKEVIYLINTVCIMLIVLIIAYAITHIILEQLFTNRNTVMTVVDCERSEGNEYYTVTVEDTNGNQWAYYDDEYKGIGTELVIGMNGNDEIIDVKGDN